MNTEIETVRKEKRTMEQLPAPTQDIQLLMENALLRNNVKQRVDFDLSFEKFAAKVSADIASQNKVFADQVFTLTAQVNTHEGRMNGFDNVLTSIKTRISVVGAVCTTLGGLLGFFIAQLINK